MIKELLKIERLTQQVQLMLDGLDEELYGYIVDFNKDLILLNEVDDFRLNGYSILHTKDIIGLRSNEMERFSERVMRDKGIHAQRVEGLNIASWYDVFSFFHHTQEVVIVESNDDEEAFLVGRVLQTLKTNAELQYINAIAEIEEPAHVVYKLIHMVNFRQEYTNVYDAYSKNPA